MSSSLLENNLNDENYKDYIDKILNIFRLSNKESSIMYEIKIEQSECVCKLSIVNNNGDNKVFNDIVFKNDFSLFHYFIDELVKKINLDVKIVSKDVVNLDNDEFVTFRMITENNDLFTIDGLEKDFAGHLIQITSDNFISEAKGINQLSNEGIGNFKIFILMIVLLILAFIGIVVFIG